LIGETLAVFQTFGTVVSTEMKRTQIGEWWNGIFLQDMASRIFVETDIQFFTCTASAARRSAAVCASGVWAGVDSVWEQEKNPKPVSRQARQPKNACKPRTLPLRSYLSLSLAISFAGNHHVHNRRAGIQSW
jgi:hypothetical protein